MYKKIIIQITLVLIIVLALAGCNDNKKQVLTCKKTTNLSGFVMYVENVLEFSGNTLDSAHNTYTVYDMIRGNVEEDKDVWNVDDYKKNIYKFDKDYVLYKDGKPDVTVDLTTDQINKYSYELRIIYKTNLDVTKLAAYENIEDAKATYEKDVFRTCEIQ